jgi:hypothetical protein
MHMNISRIQGQACYQWAPLEPWSPSGMRSRALVRTASHSPEPPLLIHTCRKFGKKIISIVHHECGTGTTYFFCLQLFITFIKGQLVYVFFLVDAYLLR